MLTAEIQKLDCIERFVGTEYINIPKETRVTNTLGPGGIRFSTEATGNHNSERSDKQLSFQRMRIFLDKVKQHSLVDDNTLGHVLSVWQKLDQGIQIPVGSVGENRQFMYSWDKDEHHLELEIFSFGPAEFFYYNRKTTESWEEEHERGDDFSQDALQHLELFH